MRILSIVVDVSALTEEQILELENKMLTPTESFNAPLLESNVHEVVEDEFFNGEDEVLRDLETDPTLH